MHDDVVDLRGFYLSSLGQVARRLLTRQVRGAWPNVAGEVVLGLGYATPLLRPFLGEAERVLAFMPASQGVVDWPRDGLNLSALVDERTLPLPDLSVHRVVLMHGLETSPHLSELLDEVWRVLDGRGKVLAIVPNRTGVWSRFDHTPFGHGRPYSASQLSRLLRDHHFAPERTHRALFVPPFRSRMLLRSAAALERVGQGWFETIGGVVMTEATKQVYRPARPGARARRRRPFLVPVGAAEPVRVGRDGAEEESPVRSARIAGTSGLPRDDV